MSKESGNLNPIIPAWHRNLLTAAAILTILLIAMGGVLCVTRSIRSCPDWPGCFGRVLPPLETSPILEFTHRLLAGSSGLVILAAAGAGIARARSIRWIFIPPLAAILLLVEVSYFGAQVVLKGLAPGWAAVDVGSALLVVALMVTAAMMAHEWSKQPALPARLSFRSSTSRLVLATVAVVYAVFVSGVLVAGPDSFTGCLGWPIYSLTVYKSDAHWVGGAIRLALSIAGLLLMAVVTRLTWRERERNRKTFRAMRWVLIVFLVELFLQALLLVIGFKTPLLIAYTVTAAFFWGLLASLGVTAGRGAVVPGYNDQR